MSTDADRAAINRANNERTWSCPFCEFEGSVCERPHHLLDHD